MVQNPPANAGDVGSIPVLGKSPGEGNDNPLQYSRLGNPMDREAWQATGHGVVKESDITQRLNKKNGLVQLFKFKVKVLVSEFCFNSSIATYG